ncbi:MAG: transposase, partial [Syntrophobacteria bacterium]
GYFGRKRKEAILGYEAFVKEGISQGRRPDLVGGGLIRSMGGWAQVLSLRRKGIKVAADERILGSSEFVETVLSEADERERQSLRLSARIGDLPSLARKIAQAEGIGESALRSGSKQRKVSRARRLFSQLAVKRMGYPGAEVARFLGVTTSAVVRSANSEELSQVESYLKVY